MRATKRSDALKLTQRALFDLSNAFSTDPEDSSDLFRRVLSFVRDVERTISRWPQQVLAIAAVLEMIAATSITARGPVLMRAVINQRESPRALDQQLNAFGACSAHASIRPTS
jgi:hypothetical protein